MELSRDSWPGILCAATIRFDLNFGTRMVTRLCSDRLMQALRTRVTRCQIRRTPDDCAEISKVRFHAQDYRVAKRVAISDVRK